jgi:hypothetical protein
MNVPKRFWSETVLIALHMNRLSILVLKSKSSIEILKYR